MEDNNNNPPRLYKERNLGPRSQEKLARWVQGVKTGLSIKKESEHKKVVGTKRASSVYKKAVPAKKRAIAPLQTASSGLKRTVASKGKSVVK